MPDAITGAAPAATAFTTSTTPTAPPQRNDQLGRDAFMQLLVAQLRFQDPLSPTNPQDFIAQTAQFNTVEKLEELTDLFTSSNKAVTLAAGGDLVGRTVSWYGEDGAVRSGAVAAALNSADGVSLVVGTDQVPLDGVIRVS
jgi:flagellar basal-body rod modification protein FlgD